MVISWKHASKALKNNFISYLAHRRVGRGIKKEIREHVHGFQLIGKT